MTQYGTTQAVNILARRRRQTALELRVAGYTYQQIYDTMLKDNTDMLPPSYSVRRVWEDVNAEIKAAQGINQELAKNVIVLELQRLDNMLQVLMPMAMEGNLKAVDRVLKIMDRRAAYLGLNSPVKVKSEDWRTEIIDLIRSGKITINDVREEFGDDIGREINQELSRSGYAGLPENTTPEEEATDGEFSEMA